MGAEISLIIEAITAVAIVYLAGKSIYDSKKAEQKLINIGIILVVVIAFLLSIIILKMSGVLLGAYPASMVNILGLGVIAIISIIAAFYAKGSKGRNDNIELAALSAISAVLNLLVLIFLV
jgi:hypothetical protein